MRQTRRISVSLAKSKVYLLLLALIVLCLYSIAASRITVGTMRGSPGDPSSTPTPSAPSASDPATSVGVIGEGAATEGGVDLAVNSVSSSAEQSQAPASFNGPLKISSNRRHLVDQSGSPFFWLGDTSWRLFVDFTREEVLQYLDTRRSQGFNVVLACAVLWGGTNGDPNPYGERPWIEVDPATRQADPTKLNEPFWEHVDWIVDQANQRGFVVAMCPINGDYTESGIINLNNARTASRLIAARYRESPNIVWVNGGDVFPEKFEGVYDELAAGLQEGDGGTHLITFHPAEFSSKVLHRKSWLSFNMIQTWINHTRINAYLSNDYNLLPVKPTGIGEAAYEAQDYRPWSNVVVTPLIVRQQAYWTYLSGGAYHIYGHADVMLKTAKWATGINAPGANQLGVLKNLLLSRGWWQLVPDQSIFASGVGSGATLNTAARSSSGDSITVYLSSPTTITINMSKITSSGAAKATWVDPKSGAQTVIGTFSSAGTRSFTNPFSEDALLLLDAAPDNIPPELSNITASGLTTTSASIIWMTDEPSDSQVEYGKTTAYGQSSALATTLVNTHIIALSGLEAGTLYHYRVKSRDRAGNLAVSEDFSFMTVDPAALPCDSPPQGKVAWLSGDGHANDLVGANNGVLKNGASFVAGKKGLAFGFDGADDALTLPITSLHNAFSALTIDAWVYPSSHGKDSLYGGIFGRTIISNTNAGQGFALRVRDGFIQADLRLTGGDVLHTFDQAQLPLNQWSHVTLTYGDGRVNAYLNGELVGSVAASGTITNVLNATECPMIGNEPLRCLVQEGSFGWHGAIDELEIFSRALSAIEIQSIYQDYCAFKGKVVIGEFRLRGPNGPLDEFIEIANNTDSAVTVSATDGSAGWSLVAADGAVRFIIPNGTTIPARGHYLGVNTAYSLERSAKGDASYSTDIADNTGIVLFRTADPAKFTPINILDAVGFGGAPAPFFEGTPLPSTVDADGEYSWVRKRSAATIMLQDTGDNKADFLFVSTTGGTFGEVQSVLGAPGPESLSSPRLAYGLSPSLVDPLVSPALAPNYLRLFCGHPEAPPCPADPNTSSNGFLSVRRKYINNTGADVTRLRFRVVDITTLNSPLDASPQADLRAISSPDINVMTSFGPALIRGTTLETAPVQSLGGGINSSLSVETITLDAPLPPGGEINVQFLLGVKAIGWFRFLLFAEALP
ncbi:MAG TPA: DUF4038 domain-containing protein [Pyrinomonadaceae bacterium]|nr:DUF4038 domain-containing protein [Pyrinomonadaceae bacterium]